VVDVGVGFLGLRRELAALCAGGLEKTMSPSSSSSTGGPKKGKKQGTSAAAAVENGGATILQTFAFKIGPPLYSALRAPPAGGSGRLCPGSVPWYPGRLPGNHGSCPTATGRVPPPVQGSTQHPSQAVPKIFAYQCSRPTKCSAM